MKLNKLRVIAFYLPQFHPIPENDEWWGAGFTEWTNVTKAAPLFKGHKQPKFPADLGYYDLRVPEIRVKQAEMAKHAGVEGFCYWHYWFGNGKQLLNRPFDEVLASGSPDFPFCLGWANETWSGIWHGAPNKVLVEQKYPSKEDDYNHFQYLLKAFKDPRYICVDKKPLLLIYKPLKLVDAKNRFDYWRELAIAEGLKGLHIVGVSMEDALELSQLGLDAEVISNLGVTSNNSNYSYFQRIIWGIRRRSPVGSLRILSYEKIIDFLTPNYISENNNMYPCVVPNWDNTPRSGKRGMVVVGSTPTLFKKSVRNALNLVAKRSYENKIVFLKSWNEWAEGNYMEPDSEWGQEYIEALRDIVVEK